MQSSCLLSFLKGEETMTQYFKHLTIIILGFVLLFMIVWFFAGSLKRDTESFNLVNVVLLIVTNRLSKKFAGSGLF